MLVGCIVSERMRACQNSSFLFALAHRSVIEILNFSHNLLFLFPVCSRNDPARLCFICAYVTLILVCPCRPMMLGGALLHSGKYMLAIVLHMFLKRLVLNLKTSVESFESISRSCKRCVTILSVHSLSGNFMWILLLASKWNFLFEIIKTCKFDKPFLSEPLNSIIKCTGRYRQGS